MKVKFVRKTMFMNLIYEKGQEADLKDADAKALGSGVKVIGKNKNIKAPKNTAITNEEVEKKTKK